MYNLLRLLRTSTHPARTRPRPCRGRAGAGLSLLILGLATGWTPLASAEIPTMLTDKIHRGSGVLDLMQDVSGAELSQYIDANGQLILGVDLNENAAGNESADSVGMAIKQMELVITTTDGVFTFNDFYTGTTALILEDGAAAADEYFVLFGTAGSSQINGGTSGFDLSVFDDVVRISDVAFTGELLDAQVNVTFLDTADTGVEGNETFFDFSNGFEDFAILTDEDAVLLEAADLGMAAASETVAFQETAPEDPPSPPPPAAPWPPWTVLALCAFVVGWRLRRE